MVDENLDIDIERGMGVYYHHSKYPLNIEFEVTNEYIDVTVKKYYKNNINASLTKSSKVINKMTKEQINDYILDIVELFIKRKIK